MTDISKLKGATREEKAKLRHAKLDTLEKLWERVGKAAKIEQVASEVRIKPDRLVRLLAEQSITTSKAGWSRLGRYARWIVLLVLVLLVLSLLVPGLLTWVFPPTERVVVRSDAGLPVGRVIGEEDVTLETGPWKAGGYTKKEGVVGRYPLKAIPSGTVLTGDQVSGRQLSSAQLKKLESSQFLSVPIKAEALSPEIVPTSDVELFFSLRDPTKEKTPEPKNAIVWAVDRSSNASSIEIALDRNDVKDVQKVLAASDVFVLRSPTSSQASQPPSKQWSGWPSLAKADLARLRKTRNKELVMKHSEFGRGTLLRCSK